MTVTQVERGGAVGDELQRLPLYMPIVRFDETNWTVTGQATVEDVDAYGTVFDYEASKRAFADWRGNVREMHDSKKAVGRAVDVQFDDDAKAIYVTTRVSRGAKDTWEKIKDGTLSGYSVGAMASKDDWTQVERSGKSVPLLTNYKLVELSLVDHPATPGCDIQIVRADGCGVDGVLMADEEIPAEQVEQGAVERNAEPTDARVGAKVSHATQGDLHGIRDSSLRQAQTTMGICGCDDCKQGMSSLDPDNDGDIDIMDSTDYLDNGQYRVLEPLVQRAISPVLQRMNGVLANFIQKTNTPHQVSQTPVTVDLTSIERRLDAIEQNGSALTEVRSLVSEVKELAERIASQPTNGGPFMNGAAMDKALATSGMTTNSAVEQAVLQRMLETGNLDDNQRLKIATEQIKLARGF